MTLGQALALHQQGHLVEAEKLYRQVLVVQPANADALHLLGVMAVQKGDALAGVEWITQAVKINPAYLDAHLNLANACLSLSMHQQALDSFDAALKLKPDLPDALNRRGAALSALGRHTKALLSHEQALKLKPDFPDAHNNRGNALAKLNRFDEALQAYGHALAIKADHFDALNNRGNVLMFTGKYQEAVFSYDLAIQLVPNHVEALSNRANALRCLNRNDEALASCELALRLQPDNVGALMNRGAILRGINRTGEALACYEKVLVLAPGHADAHWHESLCRLLVGDFAQGWRKYEWRWKSTERNLAGRNFAQPLWTGEASLQGKTILLHAEQGFGDSIQFARYAALVEARGGKVVLEMPAPLCRLMARLEGASTVWVSGEPLPDFDFHCPLLSLPLAFKTELQSIPSAPRYLTCDPALAEAWKAKLGPRQKLRVGVAWSGNKDHKNNHNRSIALADFLQIASGPAQFFGLSWDLSLADRALLAKEGGIVQLGDDLADFADTAALISNLDLVISVDTSVAHLAGALGVPTWVLLPFSPDWRWLLHRTDSPWYPSVRLFRQPAVGDWASVLSHVASEIPAMAARVHSA
ncbi:MAG: tetratricopeptide repeat protein [Pseudomonadota bacterium]